MAPLVERGAPAAELQDRAAGGPEPSTIAFLQLGSSTARAALLGRATRGARARSRAGWRSRSASRASLSCPMPVLEATGARSCYVGLPVRTAPGRSWASSAAGNDLQSELIELVRAAKFNQSGYAVMVDGDGRIIAHPDPKRINEDVSSYPAVQRARQSGRGRGGHRGQRAKQSRLFAYRPIANPGTLARQPWVLLTEINAEEQLAPLLRLRRELALGVALVLLAGLMVAHQVSRSIQRPLQILGDFAHRIGTGDLTGAWP